MKRFNREGLIVETDWMPLPQPNGDAGELASVEPDFAETWVIPTFEIAVPHDLSRLRVRSHAVELAPVSSSRRSGLQQRRRRWVASASPTAWLSIDAEAWAEWEVVVQLESTTTPDYVRWREDEPPESPPVIRIETPRAIPQYKVHVMRVDRPEISL